MDKAKLIVPKGAHCLLMKHAVLERDVILNDTVKDDNFHCFDNREELMAEILKNGNLTEGNSHAISAIM